jgi:hypothetical protein
LSPAALGTDDIPALAHDSSDGVHVLWKHYDDNDESHERVRLFAQDRLPGSHFGEAPATIGATEDVTGHVVLATGPSRTAIAAWPVGAYSLGPIQVVVDDGTTGPQAPAAAARQRGRSGANGRRGSIVRRGASVRACRVASSRALPCSLTRRPEPESRAAQAGPRALRAWLCAPHP